MAKGDFKTIKEFVATAAVGVPPAFTSRQFDDIRNTEFTMKQRLKAKEIVAYRRVEEHDRDRTTIRFEELAK